MLEIDQILKANELSIALVAAIPSFLIAGISVVGIWRWLSPKPVDPKWEALPCRYILLASNDCQNAILRTEHRLVSKSWQACKAHLVT